HDRQVDLGEDVVALAHEAWVGLDVHEDVRVARTSAECPRMAPAGDADPLAVVDAGGHVHVDSGGLDDAARAAALGARMLDERPTAVAARAGLGADELPEDAAGNLLQATAAVAARARRRSGARLRAVAVAVA